ncbi:hypothetical protein BSKO_11908 [Bryopsis sp. KO-2023]|nr:hypothetical protein BSKO_11908 [Bryopsis sp. KO-2023]
MSFGRDMFFGDDPFERMHRMMSSMDSMFDNSFFGAPRPPLQQFGMEHPRRPRGYRQGPVIEEVDDHVDHRGPSGRGSSNPIVEEPEDDGTYMDVDPSQSSHADHHYGGQPPHQNHPYQNQAYQNHPNYSHNHRRPRQHHEASHGVQINIGRDGIPEVSQFGNGVRTMFSYTSSHSMSNRGHPGQPVVYSSSSTTRIGPGGVRETTSTARDGMTGQESVTVSRAIGERGRTITRTRDATGNERSRDILSNLAQNETARFDQEWAQQASQNLPSTRGNLRSGRRRQGGQPRIEY